MLVELITFNGMKAFLDYHNFEKLSEKVLLIKLEH